jgi:hypothetical protein
VHDYFDVLGVSSDSPPQEIRRVCARRVRRWHPDFDGAALMTASPATLRVPGATDAAIDFLDMTSVLDRMQAAFFAHRD